MHKEDIHSNNMIIHGDNLEALKSLLPQYEGKIKCIYIFDALKQDGYINRSIPNTIEYRGHFYSSEKDVELEEFDE